MVHFVKIFIGYFILGAQTSEGVLLALKNLAHILSKECCKNKFCAFLPKDNFPFKCIPISKNTAFVNGAPKLYFTLYSCVVIHYFNTVYLSLYFQSTILGNYFFVFLCFMFFLSFEHDVIFIELQHLPYFL